jgi:hypothetical protein
LGVKKQRQLLGGGKRLDPVEVAQGKKEQGARLLDQVWGKCCFGEGAG